MPENKPYVAHDMHEWQTDQRKNKELAVTNLTQSVPYIIYRVNSGFSVILIAVLQIGETNSNDAN